MKKFKKISIITVLAIALVVGFTPPIPAQAATPYTFTSASGYSVIGGAAITNTGTTTTAGAVGVSPGTSISGGTITAGGVGLVTPPTSNAAQANNLSAFTAIDLTCNMSSPYIFGTGVVSLNGATLVPGVYCADAFTLSGTLTLNGGAGDVWIFKSASTLITSGTANVVGGDPCNVWWRVGSSVTLGTNTSLIGNILALLGVNAMQTGATLNGRLFAQAAGTVTLDANTITEPVCAAAPATLNVIKHVSGGTASAGDWVLTVASSNGGSGTSYADGAESPGTSYTLETGHQYGVTENIDGPVGYTATSVGTGCTIASAIAGTAYTCTITNTYTPPVVRHSSSGSTPRVVVPVFSPTITILSTPVPVVVVPIIPKLPKTGFAPQESGTWYESLLNNILNLFR